MQAIDTNRSVSLTLTADDHVAATKLYVLEYATSRGPLVFWLVSVALLLGSLFVSMPRPRDQPFVVLFYICVAAVIVLPFFWYFVGAVLSARRAYAAQKTLHHPVTVAWSEKGWSSSAQQGEWNIPWSDYLKWTEDSKVILLYQGPRLFNMLPKRVLTPAQIDDLRQLVAANVKRT